MKEQGFERGKASPCNFYHAAKELAITVHGDDFVIAGPLASIQWFQVKMQCKYEVKTDVVGPAPEGCSEELKILGRIVR